MLNPKKMTKDNAAEIKGFLEYSDKYMSLAKFPTLYLWHEYTELSYDIQDDVLFMFECKFDNTALMPFGPGDLEKAMYNLEDYCKSKSKVGRLYCMGEKDKEKIDEIFPGRYNIHELQEFSEYVYSRENLTELNGKKYAKKRNHISKFLRHVGDSFDYTSISKKDRDELEQVIDTWCMNRDCGPGDTTEYEKQAILKLLSNEGDIEYRGGAIRINGNIEAFALGGRITEDMAVVYFEKADTRFNGIYAALNKLYVSNEWQDVKYINRQEDMGLVGLRKSKRSYYPDFMVKNYSLAMK